MEKLSRFISFLLRHHPETLDLKMDSEGWVNTKELIQKINSDSKYHISKELLEEIVATDNKGRYVFKGKNNDFIKIARKTHHFSGVDISAEYLKN